MHQNFWIGIRCVLQLPKMAPYYRLNMFILETHHYCMWKAMYKNHEAHLVSWIILFWIFLRLLLSICFELPDHQVVRPTISKSPLSKAIVFDLPLCPILFNWGREPHTCLDFDADLRFCFGKIIQAFRAKLYTCYCVWV